MRKEQKSARKMKKIIKESPNSKKKKHPRVISKNASYKLLFLDISGISDLDLTIAGRDTVLIDGTIETQEADVFYEFSTEYVGTPIQDGQETILAYNLNIPILGSAFFKNSQINAKVTGELNLGQIGNQEVDFGGQIIVEDGSVISFTDYFDELQGLVSFDNKGFNPYIDVSANTMVDDERIELMSYPQVNSDLEFEDEDDNVEEEKK